MAFSRWIEHLPWVVELTGNVVEISIVWGFHFLGFFLVVGTTTIINLRVLGLAGRRHRLGNLAEFMYPWMWLGLIFVTVSGFLMFAGYAVQEYPATVFRVKVGLFLVAILFGIAVQQNVSKWDRLPITPAGAKALALVSMLLWIGMILASVEVPAFIACI
jgi:hypothetical protein